MKISFYCSVDGQGFGFALPDEADKFYNFCGLFRSFCFQGPQDERGCFLPLYI